MRVELRAGFVLQAVVDFLLAGGGQRRLALIGACLQGVRQGLGG